MVGGLVFAHSPWVFARLSLPLQVGAYLAILVVPVLVGSTCGKLGDAFEQTAAGASQAAERKVREKAEEEQAAFQQKLEETQDALDEVKRLSDKLEGCFSTFGHRLPELEERVRDSLHNPSSFEHIETLAIVPDGDGNTVAMNFRAENGFGAIRSTHVLAKVIPDTCAIESVTEPQ